MSEVVRDSFIEARARLRSAAMRAPELASQAVTLAASSARPRRGRRSPSQESIFMDDPKIVYSAPEKLEGTLAEMKRLGADRIRVSVFWHLLAPDPESETRPFAGGRPAPTRATTRPRSGTATTGSSRPRRASA